MTGGRRHPRADEGWKRLIANFTRRGRQLAGRQKSFDTSDRSRKRARNGHVMSCTLVHENVA